MKIVRFSIDHPVTVSMLALAAVLFGLVALGRLPLNLLPEISYPSLTVETEFPDAAPAEVENLVTRPLEEAVGVVNGLRRLTSRSAPGLSQITLEFAWNTRMDYASLDVREKVDLVNLPDGVKPPVLLRFDPSLDPILRLGVHGPANLVALREVAERAIKTDLESLDGVAAARVVGGLEEEIQVEVDSRRLARLGLPIAAVGEALAAANVNVAGGRLRDREAEFLVRASNPFAGVDEIARTILHAEGGRVVRLADVAEVRRGHKERDVVTRIGGEEAVEIAIYKEGDANTVSVAHRVRDRLEALEKGLPAGMRVRVLLDQSTYIARAVDEVKANAVLGGLLAVLILFLFLRDLRPTAIIALSIPLSLVVTFVAMQELGISLNIMSLGGLALGVGMLVDNSIVVLEAIMQRREAGEPARSAALAGTTEVGRAVSASTLTTIAVFLPIVFVEGIAGQIFRDMALTVTASLAVSLAVALTVVPMVAGFQRRAGLGEAAERERAGTAAAPPAQEPAVRSGLLLFLGRPAAAIRRLAARLRGPLGALVFGLPALAIRAVRPLVRLAVAPVLDAFDRGYRGLGTAHAGLLARALVRPGRVIALTGALALLTGVLATRLGVELIPTLAQGEFAFDLELPEGTPLAVTALAVAGVEEEIRRDPRLGVVFAEVGRAERSGAAVAEKKESIAQLGVALARPGDRAAEAAVIEDIRAVLARRPGIQATFRRPTTFSFKKPVEVLVFGEDLREITAVASDLAVRLGRIQGLRDVESSAEPGSPEIVIQFDRERLASLGLDVGEVSRVLRHKIHGEVVTRLKERDRQIDVRVRTAGADELGVGEVGNLVVSEVEATPVVLATVAGIGLERGPARIERVDQQRAAMVSANLSGRDLGSVTEDILAAVRGATIPPTVTVALGGQHEELGTSYRSLVLAIVLAILLVYMVMASQFESLLHPFVILLTVPMGLMGAVWALLATGTAVSVVVLIGVVMLAGIVVNNAIVLIDHVNQRRAAGVPKRAALLEAGRVRLRPILMTTTTTVLGLLPMALGIGEGAEVRAPLAIAVIGGLTVSTLLTLVVIPCLYDVLDRSA